MYHTATPCLLHVARCFGLLFAITFVTDSAMGVALKSNTPNICAYAGNIEFFREVRKIFIVISA